MYQKTDLDALLNLATMEDALFRKGAKVWQRVQIDAEQVLPLQHGHALRVGAELLRQLQPLSTAGRPLIVCMKCIPSVWQLKWTASSVNTLCGLEQNCCASCSRSMLQEAPSSPAWKAAFQVNTF